MTLTLPGADIRGYYQALGIELPGWASTATSVRCFADPEAHRRGDHDPSCSVNLEHGAWHCHACGAKGGAFDAATARGYSDRAAIDLMVAFRLTEHRGDPACQRQTWTPSPLHLQAACPTSTQAAAPQAGKTSSAGKPRSPPTPTSSPSSPESGAGSTPRCSSSNSESTADASLFRSATTSASSSGCCATNPGRGAARRRCSPPPAHVGRCCRTPPPNPPPKCSSWRASQT